MAGQCPIAGRYVREQGVRTTYWSKLGDTRKDMMEPMIRQSLSDRREFQIGSARHGQAFYKRKGVRETPEGGIWVYQSGFQHPRYHEINVTILCHDRLLTALVAKTLDKRKTGFVGGIGDFFTTTLGKIVAVVVAVLLAYICWHGWAKTTDVRVAVDGGLDEQLTPPRQPEPDRPAISLNNPATSPSQRHANHRINIRAHMRQSAPTGEESPPSGGATQGRTVSEAAVLQQERLREYQSQDLSSPFSDEGRADQSPSVGVESQLSLQNMSPQDRENQVKQGEEASKKSRGSSFLLRQG